MSLLGADVIKQHKPTQLMDEHEQPTDPHDYISHCVTDVTAMLLIGEKISQEKMQEITDAVYLRLEILGTTELGFVPGILRLEVNYYYLLGKGGYVFGSVG